MLMSGQKTAADESNRHRLPYLAAQVLSQPWPAGGAVIDDWLLGAEDSVTLGGVFFVASVDHQPAHFDQAVPVVLVKVGRGVLVPARRSHDHRYIPKCFTSNLVSFHFSKTSQSRVGFHPGTGEVAPEQSAEPQRGVREDPGGELPQSLPVQHRDVGGHAVTKQGHQTLFRHVVHAAGEQSFIAVFTTPSEPFSPFLPHCDVS